MVTQSNLDKHIIDVVNIYKKDLMQAGIVPKQIIVFGSQATGKARPWSDIDVCVVADVFGKDRFSDRLKLMHIINTRTLDIEPHPMSPEELAEHWDPFSHEIRTHGIIIQ